MHVIRILTAVWSVLLGAGPALAFQPPSGQTEFVPANELPPIEQLPAAPLLVTAYAFFLVLMIFYIWTVWRRLNQVDADIRALQQRAPRSAR